MTTLRQELRTILGDQTLKGVEIMTALKKHEKHRQAPRKYVWYILQTDKSFEQVLGGFRVRKETS